MRVAKYVITFCLVLMPLGYTYSDTGEKLELGAALALTGTAAPFGMSELKGIQLAIDEVNAAGGIQGKKLHLNVEDTTSTGSGTVTAVTKLINLDQFKIVIGPSWLDSFQGALSIAERNGVLLLTPSAGITNIKKGPAEHPLVFSTYINFQREMEHLVKEIATRNIKKVALVFDQDPYCEGMRAFTKEALTRRGIEIGSDHSFLQGEGDFRAMLTRLRSKNLNRVIFVSIDQGSVLSFLKQQKEIFPQAVVFSSHDMESYLDNPSFSGLLNGMVYVVPAEPEVAFINAYEAKFKEKPILTSANAYDAVMLLVAALRQGKTTPEFFAQFLRQGQFKSAAFGVLRFDTLGGVSGGSFQIRTG